MYENDKLYNIGEVVEIGIGSYKVPWMKMRDYIVENKEVLAVIERTGKKGKKSYRIPGRALNEFIQARKLA